MLKLSPARFYCPHKTCKCPKYLTNNYNCQLSFCLLLDHTDNKCLTFLSIPHDSDGHIYSLRKTQKDPKSTEIGISVIWAGYRLEPQGKKIFWILSEGIFAFFQLLCCCVCWLRKCCKEHWAGPSKVQLTMSIGWKSLHSSIGLDCQWSLDAERWSS